MRHAFIVDPLPALNVTADTTVAVMREAARRGHEVHSAEVEDLCIVPGGQVVGELARMRLLAGDDPWYQLEPAVRQQLAQFDVVWMRKDPPYDLNYFFASHLLSLIPGPTLRVNEPEGLREVTEKLFVLRFPELIPETFVSRRIDDLIAFHAEIAGDMILKPVDGCGGEGVFHISKDGRNLKALLELATEGGRRYQIAQRYLPEAQDGDKRIILLEGEPIGAVLRVPQAGETRANFHAGGSPIKAGINDREREICARLRPSLREHGILFAGIDVIGRWLTEVNVTSPTGIREINALDGVELERQFLDAVERRVAERRAGQA